MKTTLAHAGDRLFRFIVISDTHINQAEDKAAAFFPLNRLANGRARIAFAAARRYRPEFVLHVGDIVHPMPSHPGFDQACANYRELESAFDCPVYLTPGNHDIGDKPWPMAPVAQINPKYMAKYEAQFGRQWYTWQHGDCDFFVLNTSLLNAGLPQEQEQAAWFEQALAAAPDRKFLSLHYPPHVRDAHEPSHYDNLDEPARSWLLSLIERHGIEAVFCGHVHNLWYNQHGDTEFYLLPSTAFVRQDYSELQRVTPPGAEGGRQDVDKLGYFVVDVFERGHVARFVRLPAQAPDEGVSLADTLSDRTPLHIKTAPARGLAVDPGYPWAEDVAVPASGALDAFDHKIVRNDYPLFALCDMGIGTLRIPLSDLMRDTVRARFLELARIGLRAHLVLTAIPSSAQHELLRTLGEAVTVLEFVVAPARLRDLAPDLAGLAAALPHARLLISKLRSPADAAVDGLQYGHLIFHGWIAAECEEAAVLLRECLPTDTQAGLMFRARMSESPLQLAETLDGFTARTGIACGMLARLSTDNPALAQEDDAAACRQALEAAVAKRRHPELQVAIEGLVDFDRGYFLRRGLIDRSFNPRLAGAALKHLCALLESLDGGIDAARAASAGDGVSHIEFHTKDVRWTILIGRPGCAAWRQAATTTWSGGSHCWSLPDGEPVRDPEACDRFPQEAMALLFATPDNVAVADSA
ncbi:metallophosphoesterase [Bordetella genomosp. 9]|nr:metallophosphoesterase [Bordetella genomosp. 9]